MATEASPDPRLHAMVGSGLAFVAGFVDTCGFIALFGLFTAHVTGNFVVIGASLVEPRPGLVTKLLALPVFVVTVAATHLVMVARTRGGKANPVFALLTQALFLVGFMIAGIAALPIVYGDQPLAMLAGVLGVTAMGVQNAAARVPFKDFAPTTVMTGNTTQLVMDGVDVATGNAPPAIVQRFHKTRPVVLAFASGAIVGALGFGRVSFWCLGFPVLVLLVLARVMTGRREGV
jgi:uncharacterized membrane protein YoaK (UPF0700 family)